MATSEAQKAYNRAKTARYRARQGREAINAQARALYHQHDDDPALREGKQAQRRAKDRRWYANHREEKIAKVMARSEKRAQDPVLAEIDRQALNVRTARWRERYPEKQAACETAYRQAHPAKINATRRARYAKDPTKHLSDNKKRYALRRGAPRSDLTIAQWQIIKEHYGHRCVYCGKKPKQLTQDHITPLSAGGSDTLWNVVPACRSCNSKKGKGKVPKPVQPILL
jgi:5-methylcytosine-specific restriction endonuclease McrA